MAALRKVRRSIRYERFLKLTRPLEYAEGPAPEILSEQEVENLDLRTPEGATPMLQRLKQNDVCYALRGRAGEVEAFVWVASGHAPYVYELGANLEVPGDVAYFYDAFTFPDARNRGLMRELVEGVVATLKDDGHPAERCEAWIASSNASSLRAFENAKFKVYGRWRALGIGPLSVRRGAPWIGSAGSSK